MRVLVKGAGVAGLTAALELARRDVNVTICDRATLPGRGASWLAGGMLAPWCESETAGAAVVTFGSAAAKWWEEATPGLVARRGTLVVATARDEGELRRFAGRTGGHEWVDGPMIAALEPDLAGRFRRGLFFRDEAHLDPRLALATLHDRLAGMGVAFRLGVPADEEGFDRIVDCTGSAASGRLAGLRGVRGEMLYLETREIDFARPVRFLHPRIPLYIVARGDGRFMVGATMVETDDDRPISARSLAELLNAAYAVHPAFAEAAVLETGVGIRPAFADNLPRLVARGRTIFINGAWRHGFLLSPAMARKAGDLVLSACFDKEAIHEIAG